MSNDTPHELTAAANESPPLRTGWRWLPSRSHLLVGLGIAAVLATAAALLPGASSSSRVDPQLTHTVTRSDLRVTVTEQGTLESAENLEIKSQVRGANTVIWVIESGSYVESGDELMRLDTLFIEEQINERTKYAHWSRSAAERSKADVARAKLAIGEYEEGRYVAQLATLQKDLAVAQSNVRTAQSMLEHAERMYENGYISDLQFEENKFAVTQARLALDFKKTQIEVLSTYTKAEELERLRGNLAATKARHAANVERAFADASRRDRALEEHKHCVVKAPRSGLVIHPSAARWENAPQVTEGATVHKDQVLLLMPDLSQMQVNVGIRESTIDRMKPGLTAQVRLPTQTLDGEVTSVASVTRPAGWWTGNVVKYDTLVQLPPVDGLMPGMGAEVEILIAQYEDVLTLPVAAIIEEEEANYCWVKTADGFQRRALKLGDSSGVFTIVEAGVKEGDVVILNPLALEGTQRRRAKKSDDQGQDAPSKSQSASPQS
jgi:multidrug efflux pump subunit AcrA (membrane-fusion protein)